MSDEEKVGIVVQGEKEVETVENMPRYFARLTHEKGVYSYIVKIDSNGCFVIDETNGWEKDSDYKEEAISNTHLYKELSEAKVGEILKSWNKEL